MEKTYTFGEKKTEWSQKQGKNIDVIISPKYKQSKEKAIETLKEKDYLNEGDFWILMNETKSGKMQYAGLIISHNACLKINDRQPPELKFKPSGVSLIESGYGSSLVFVYVNEEQGIYEVGEVNCQNCKNAYPYAMAFKRLFDRVVLKLCKLAFDGIYSDSEADEFKDRGDLTPEEDAQIKSPERETHIDVIKSLMEETNTNPNDLLGYYKVKTLEELTNEQAVGAIRILEQKVKR